MASRKLVLDLEPIEKSEYEQLKADTGHVLLGSIRDDGFLHHDGNGYCLYIEHNKRYYAAGSRGFDFQNWSNMTLEGVEFDPIAIYNETNVKFGPVLPGQPLPSQGTPEQNMAEMKRKQPAKKMGAGQKKAARKRA